MGNLWAIKSSLRSFELAFGLKANFGKRCLMSVNVQKSSTWPRLSSISPLVGGNPKSLSTWEPVIDTLR